MESTIRFGRQHSYKKFFNLDGPDAACGRRPRRRNPSTPVRTQSQHPLPGQANRSAICEATHIVGIWIICGSIAIRSLSIDRARRLPGVILEPLSASRKARTDAASRTHMCNNTAARDRDTIIVGQVFLPERSLSSWSCSLSIPCNPQHLAGGGLGNKTVMICLHYKKLWSSATLSPCVRSTP